MAGRIPGARLVSIPASHMHFGRGTSNVNAEVRAFLTELHETKAGRTRSPIAFLQPCSSPTSSTPAEKAAELGDRRWRELLERHHSLVRQRLARFRGVEVDTAGDGFLASFDGPARAICCASAIVERGARARHRGARRAAHRRMRARWTARSRASPSTSAPEWRRWPAPGEVLVSSTVKDLVAGSGIVFADHGVHELKGVPGEWRLFRVATEAT